MVWSSVWSRYFGTLVDTPDGKMSYMRESHIKGWPIEITYPEKMYSWKGEEILLVLLAWVGDVKKQGIPPTTDHSKNGPAEQRDNNV